METETNWEGRSCPRCGRADIGARGLCGECQAEINPPPKPRELWVPYKEFHPYAPVNISARRIPYWIAFIALLWLIGTLMGSTDLPQPPILP